MSSTDLPPLGKAHIRVARPTLDIPALLPFYCSGLGFEVLYRSTECMDGLDAIIMLGHRGSGYHLEFTQPSLEPGHDLTASVRALSEEHLLVFYLPDDKEFSDATTRMANKGFLPVKSKNPYWDRCGKTFEDPDGWRVVFANMAWPVVPKKNP